MPIYDLANPNAYVPKETYRQRAELCATCPERIEKYGEDFKKTSRCPDCGCFIRLKARLKTEYCPLGDW